MNTRLRLNNKRFHILDYLVVILIFYCLLIRLSNLDHNYGAFDVHRDYFISYHIKNFGEFPLVGPRNSVFGSVVLPTVYFFGAGLLYIKDSIITLDVANIILQMLGLFFLYLLGKELFSRLTGFIAVLLYGLSNVNLHQATFFYEPFISQVFLLASFLLLAKAYKQNKIVYLYSSILIYLLAVSFYSSGIALLPLLIILWAILFKKFYEVRKLMPVLVVFLVLFIIIYHPFFLNAGQTIGSILNEISFNHFFSVYYSRLLYFLGSFFSFYSSIGRDVSSNRGYSGLEGFNFFPVLILLFVIVLSCIYFLSKKIDKSRKIIMGIFILAMLTTVFFLSIIKLYYLDPFHFVSVTGLFVLFVSEVVATLELSFTWAKVFNYGLVIILVFLFSFNPNDLLLQPERIGKFYDNNHSKLQIANYIESRVRKLKVEYNFNNYGFFDIKSFNNYGSWMDKTTPPFYWNKLEHDLGQQFTTIRGLPNGELYKTINKPAYIFVTCTGPENLCADQISQDYDISKSIDKYQLGNNILYLFKNA